MYIIKFCPSAPEFDEYTVVTFSGWRWRRKSPLDAPAFCLYFWNFLLFSNLPQKKQRQQLQDMVSQLKINDEVVTNGGVIGKIKEVKDSSFIIQSAEKSFLEIGKSAVVGKKP